MCTVFIAGCKSYSIRTYSVAKETQVQTLNQMPLSVSSHHFGWVVPTGWQTQPSSQMRLASFVLDKNGTEVSLVGLPGGGDLLSNINRWAGQIQMPLLTDDQLSSVSKPFAHPEWPMTFVSLYGQEKAILAVIFESEGQTYFIKMMGASQAVKANRSSFEAFARSFKHEKH